MVEILLCTDNAQAEYIPTLLNSISLNNKQCRVYCILTEVLYTVKQHIIQYCPTNIDLFFWEYVPEIPNVWNSKNIACKVKSTAMFTRLFAPKLIEEIDRVIYMDIDTIVDGDLTDLYNWGTGNRGLAASWDTGSPYLEQMCANGKYIDGECIIPYANNQKAFNSGVLVMDFNKLRENNIFEFTMDCLRKQYMTDQAILNLYCQGNFVELPLIYNYPANGSNDEWEAIKPNAVIYHWYGKKPWNRQARHNQAKYDQYDIRDKKNIISGKI